MKTDFKSDRLDQTDLKILSQLRMNARETLTKICKKTRIPISTIFDRLKRLEELNVIKRHTSLFDMKKLGIHVRVLLLIKVKEDQKNELESYLTKNPFVNNLFRTNGEISFAVEHLFRDMKGLESFSKNVRKRFKGIEFSVHHILEDLKKEDFLAGKDISQDMPIE